MHCILVTMGRTEKKAAFSGCSVWSRAVKQDNSIDGWAVVTLFVHFSFSRRCICLVGYHICCCCVVPRTFAQRSFVLLSHKMFIPSSFLEQQCPTHSYIVRAETIYNLQMAHTRTTTVTYHLIQCIYALGKCLRDSDFYLGKSHRSQVVKQFNNTIIKLTPSYSSFNARPPMTLTFRVHLCVAVSVWRWCVRFAFSVLWSPIFFLLFWFTYVISSIHS